MLHFSRHGRSRASCQREFVTMKEDKGDPNSGLKEEQSLGGRWVKIASVVTLYWFVSISMVFINKYLLSSQDLKLGTPLFITFSQCAVAMICFVILGLLSSRYPDSISFPPPEINLQTQIRVLPLSVVFVGMIVFNNLTLKYLGVAFYNVGRSLTTVFNVSFSFAVLGQTISLRVIACCGVIVSGFLLGLKEEDKTVENLSIFGVLSGVLASLCVALYAIFTKKVLPNVDNNIWRLQYYNNFNALLLLLPLIFFTGEFRLLQAFPYWTSPYVWLLLITAGVFGIAIGYVTALQIQVTSPLTHNVSGTAKACAQTILACVVYSDRKPFWWWVSNAMVLGGSSAYTYVRMLEMKTSTMEDKHKAISSSAEPGGGTEDVSLTVENDENKS